MKFSTELPKKSGWFWAKRMAPMLPGDDNECFPCFVDDHLSVTIGIASFPVELSGIQLWAGPIPKPGEVDPDNYRVLLPIDAWHEDRGPVLWWRLPICEPPYVGSPGDSDWPTLLGTNGQDWATHFSLVPEVDISGIEVPPCDSHINSERQK